VAGGIAAPKAKVRPPPGSPLRQPKAVLARSRIFRTAAASLSSSSGNIQHQLKRNDQVDRLSVALVVGRLGQVVASRGIAVAGYRYGQA